MSDSDLLEIVPTRAAAFKPGAATEFKAIVFESHKPKRVKNVKVDEILKDGIQENQKTMKRSESDEKNPTQTGKYLKKNAIDEDGGGPEFDMKKARHEIIKFGVSGFTTKNKKKAQIALAVKLGAEPPKKMYKNYKDLLKEKKMAKQQREEKQRLRQLGKNQTGAAIIRYKKPKLPKKKKDLGEISKHYGVINPKIGRKKK